MMKEKDRVKEIKRQGERQGTTETDVENRRKWLMSKHTVLKVQFTQITLPFWCISLCIRFKFYFETSVFEFSPQYSGDEWNLVCGAKHSTSIGFAVVSCFIIDRTH